MPNPRQHPQDAHAYYGHGPLIHLKKHLCIIGHRGSENHKAVRYLGALLGLHYVILDEVVAHALGESPLAFIEREGMRRYRRIETQQLGALLARTPCGLIALSSDVLSGRWTRFRTRQRATTVWLNLQPEALVANVKADRQNYPGLPSFLTEAAYTRYLERTWKGVGASLSIEVFDTHPSKIADQIMCGMGWSVG